MNFQSNSNSSQNSHRETAQAVRPRWRSSAPLKSQAVQEQEQIGGQEELLSILTSQGAAYYCPGESSPITGAVHQARLRAHFPKCRTCPHREDVTVLSEESRAELGLWWNLRPQSRTHFQDGFRGIALNELTMKDIRQIAESFCESLRNQALTKSIETHEPRPTLVMGHDHRVASLEVIRTAVNVVREQGCRVIDVGGVTAACLKYTVEHLEADAGVHATAAGGTATEIGLDLYHRGGIPLSAESLYSLENKGGQPIRTRCGRSEGGVRLFPARKAYLGSLWKYYQGHRPLKLAVLCQNEYLMEILRELAQETAHQITFLTSELVPYPSLKNETLSAENQWQILEEELQQGEYDLGIWLDEVGQACRFFDGSGKDFSSVEILQLLKRQRQAETGQEPFLLLGEECEAWFEDWTPAEKRQVRYRQSLREHFCRGMTTAKTSLGLDGQHRFWFATPQPVCDGLITLGKVLQIFS